jgi:hypothetical protein
MEPEPGNPWEMEGVLTPPRSWPLWRVLPFPAVDRAGELLAHWDGTSAVRPSLDSVRVERLGIAQEPEAA